MTEVFWTPERDAVLVSCSSYAEAAKKLETTVRNCRGRMQRLRLRGGGKQFANAKVFWTPARDKILLSVTSLEEAARLLGVTRVAVRKRRERIGVGQKRSPEWTPQEDEILKRERKVADAAKLLSRSISACHGRLRHLRSMGDAEPALGRRRPVSFLDALERYEKPPTNVAVRDRQPLMHNPSLYQGSGCSSSAAMD